MFNRAAPQGGPTALRALLLCAIDLPISAFLRKKTSFRRVLLTHLDSSNIGTVAPDGCADFFSIDDLDPFDYAGGVNDRVAATTFRAPQKARYTVTNYRAVMEDGQITSLDTDPVVEGYYSFSHDLAGARSTRRSP